MTPLQKAKALYNYYDDLLNKDFSNPIVNDNQLKQCALTAVDEITNGSRLFYTEDYHYWEEVKQEIEKL